MSIQMIRKAFPSRVKAIDRAAGIYEAMISTESVDREGDIVRATGAQLGNFFKNPVVLFGHDYNAPPVAKALSVDIIPGMGIKSTFQFPAKGINQRADEIHGLWDAGFLNATSIGFIPLASKPLTDSSWGPQEYTSWELLEYSIIPVPANADALALAAKTISRGLKNNRKNSSREVPQEVLKLIELTLAWIKLFYLPTGKQAESKPHPGFGSVYHR